ncbi:MAG: cytochrome c/ABC transporter substrate-binding protein [Akkermansiaceae bacterium]
MRPTRQRGFCAGLVLTLLGCVGSLVAQELTDLEKAGQHIYRTGTSLQGGAIPTYLGESTSVIPSQLFACTNCHGADGKGVAEGGIKPSNITWHSLTKPYGAIAGTHRARPPYTAEQVLIAIGEGRDPMQQTLESSMPRYQLSAQDGASLIAYLKVIHRVQDRGVSADSINIAIMMPHDSRYTVVQQALTTYFDMVNSEGGIYRRMIEIHPLQLSDKPENWEKECSSFFQKNSIFALLAPIADHHTLGFIQQIAASHQVLVLSPLEVDARKRTIPNPYLFYFYPSIQMQCDTLLQYAQQLNSDAVVVKITRSNIDEIPVLKTGGAKTLIISEDVVSDVLNQLQEISWFPRLLLPISYSVEEIASYPSEVYMAYPHQSLRPRTDPDSLQKSSVIAADTLRNILLKSGRRLTKSKVIESLEQLHEHETRWTGPLTFSANQRTGAKGAYVLKYNPNSTTWLKDTPWVPLK